MSKDNTHRFEGPSIVHSGRIEDGDSCDVAVVEAIADAADSDPHELDVLQEVIDVDALERLVDSRGSEEIAAGHVTFSYCGYEVTITTDRTLILRG